MIVYRRFPRAPLRILAPVALVRLPFRLWVDAVATQPDHRKAVRQLLELDQDLRLALDQAAIAYDGGVHAKHRLTGYHDFFVERIAQGERVLDVGSGKGELAHDLAVRKNATVVGIDNDPAHLIFARERFVDPRVSFVEGDIREDVPPGPFDVIVLSNVLEHLDGRTELLQTLVARTCARSVLIRVPVLKRDWTVPLREELGLQHFSDPGHEVEYDLGLLEQECAAAGLRVDEAHLVWSEIWAAASPAGA